MSGILGIISRTHSQSSFDPAEFTKEFEKAFSFRRWTIALSFLGTIYVRDGPMLTQQNFEREFLIPYRHSPVSFLRSLRGSFCFCLWDDDTFSMGTDAFGTYMLHYAETPEYVTFSTRITTLKKLIGSGIR